MRNALTGFLAACFLVVAGGMPAGFTTAAQAQEKGVLNDLLGELLQGERDKQAPANVQEQPVQKRTPFGRTEMQLSFAPLVKQTAAAVVNVYASKAVKQRLSPLMGDPFFEQFFGGGRRMQPRVQSSLGSGVIVDGSGLVVTNYHVIRDADEVKVALSDGREYESTVLLKDETVDLAVLKIETGETLPFLEFSDSDALEVGDLVLAIGNPFGVGQTTTSGIVSALARSHIGVSDFGFFIQTDAAINPGNSGGALIDMAGRLIGINTAIYSRSGGSIGIGFAIPSIMVRAVVNAARNGGDYFERPYLGAVFDAVTPQAAEALGMPRPSGALVSNVTEGSPAAKAGLKPGDVLLALNGRPIEHPDALGYRLATQIIGSTASFDVLRKGKAIQLAIAMEKAPADTASTSAVEIGGNSPFAGSKVTEISPRLAQKLRLPDTARGVVIVDIARNSPAARFGLLPGDIVRELNGEEISKAEQLNTLAMERTRWWRFAIERDGQMLRQVLRF